MKRTIAIALAVAALPGLAGAQGEPLNTGYWQVSTDWLGLVKKTERYCIDARNIAKIMLGPCNHHYRCVYPVQQVGDGRAHFEGEIRGHDELYRVKGDATYSLTSLDMTMSGSGHWHVVPIVGVSASVQARFLDPECPVGAKRL